MIIQNNEYSLLINQKNIKLKLPGFTDDLDIIGKWLVNIAMQSGIRKSNKENRSWNQYGDNKNNETHWDWLSFEIENLNFGKVSEFKYLVATLSKKELSIRLNKEYYL